VVVKKQSAPEFTAAVPFNFCNSAVVSMSIRWL